MKRLFAAALVCLFASVSSPAPQNGAAGPDHRILTPLNADSWHSIELNATHKVKEWADQPVRFALEEDAFLFSTGWQWVIGRQTEFYLIK